MWKNNNNKNNKQTKTNKTKQQQQKTPANMVGGRQTDHDILLIEEPDNVK